MKWLLVWGMMGVLALPGWTQKARQMPDGRILAAKDPATGHPVFEQEEIRVVAMDQARSAQERRQLEQAIKRADKLRHNIRVAYPLARKVGRILNETNEKLATLTSDAEKDRYLKQLEKTLKEEYTPVIYRLTLSQGKILIKLIHRETSASAYELVRSYRSGATALFWQTVAKFFGANLKNAYDPQGADAAIEMIVRQIETGEDRYYF
ncbi:MAG: DUF4294 domain-containing protein [Bacteroidetes bacterium]|nr:DUF4294 domain-containing protein [Bacteroidota bacterium]